MQKPGFVSFKVEKFTNASATKILENKSNGYKKIRVEFKNVEIIKIRLNINIMWPKS